MPTHIKHNSSKISDRSVFTLQFLEKLVIDREISKEFFAIDRFIYCTLLFINIHILYTEFYDRSQKIPLKFCDQFQFFLEIVQRINRSIAKIQRNFLRLIVLFTVHYCSLMYIFCTLIFAIDRKKFL